MAANVTTIPGANQVGIFLRNYPWATMTTDMPALTIGWATDVSRLTVKGPSGAQKKIMLDASTTSNMTAAQIPYANANGELTSSSNHTNSGTSVSVTGGGEGLQYFTKSASSGVWGAWFRANNTTPAEFTYARVYGGIVSPTAGNESGYLRFDSAQSGSVSAQMYVGYNNMVGIKGVPTLATLDVTGDIAASSLTASRAMVTDGSKVLSSSATTATEIGYVSGVTSAIQTQLDGKANFSGGVNNQVITATGASSIQGEANLTFDGSLLAVTGDVGIGKSAIEDWDSTYSVLYLGGNTSMATRTSEGASSSINLVSNARQSAAGWKRISNDQASNYAQVDGRHLWFTAAAGTPDVVFSFTQAMELDASGNLGIGVSPTSGKLHVNGDVYANGDVYVAGGKVDVGSGQFTAEITGGGTPVASLTSAVSRMDLSGSNITLAADSNRVGVGKVPSLAKLDVFGDGYISTEDAGTTTIVRPLTLEHTSSGTPAAGFGSGLLLSAEDQYGSLRNAGAVDAYYLGGTNYELHFSTCYGGSLVQALAVEHNGLRLEERSGFDTELIVNSDNARDAVVEWKNNGASVQKMYWDNSESAFRVSSAFRLDSLTASRALVSDANKGLVSSAATATEIGYLSGLSSNCQAQLDGKIDDLAWTQSTSFTVNGFSSTSYKDLWYTRIDDLVYIWFNVYGTSNSTSFTITLPGGETPSGMGIWSPCMVIDNGSDQSSPGMAYVAVSSSTVVITKDWASSGFTSSGTKAARGILIFRD